MICIRHLLSMLRNGKLRDAEDLKEKDFRQGTRVERTA